MIKLKRIYGKPAKNDGVRILVDRLWPRGVSKKEAQVDLWLKEIAPSDDLRRWFEHDEAKWDKFKEKYKNELENKLFLVEPLIKYLEKDHGTITFVYAAKDEKRNNAVVLKSLL